MPSATAVDKHCVFRCGGSWYSLLATSVREVMMAPPWVRMPGGDTALAGLCHVRNEFIPALSLPALLGEAEATGTSNGKLLVIGGSAGNWALLVDEVVALEPLETLTMPDARSVDHRQAAVLGTATFRDQVVRVLDPNRLYRSAEHRLRDSWNEWIAAAHHLPDSKGDVQ